jgi:hypothetical protein
MSIGDIKKMTAKAVIEKLPGLSDEELDALYDDELDGKGRKSLLNAITARRDELRESGSVPSASLSITVSPVN